MDGKTNGKDIENIISYLQKKQEGFDSVAQLSRDIIRGSGLAITLLHNKDVEGAKKRISDIEEIVGKIRIYDKDFAYYSVQAYQEYAEAKIFYGIKTSGRIYGPGAIGVRGEAYLFGLLDVAGELKREIVEALSEGCVSDAERYYALMKEIYDSTRSIRFAEAVLPGFRKKQDVARIQLENAGSDILLAKQMRSK